MRKKVLRYSRRQERGMIMRGLSIELVLLLFLILVPTLDFKGHATPASSRVIYVDEKNVLGPWFGTLQSPYRNITSGMTDASNGDTVFVRDGTYYEQLIITRSITLRGQEKYRTIVDANQTGDAVRIVANSVKVTGFTIQNSGPASSGVSLQSSSGNNISQNILKGNNNGIFLFQSTDNTLTNNNVSNNYYGISLSASNRNNITESNVSSNEGAGIRISDSSNIIVSDNNLTENGFGVVIIGSDNSTFVNNNVSLNINDGLYVFVSHNNVFSNNRASSNADSGIRVGQSTDNFVNNNVFSNDKFGVLLENSTANVIATNNFLANFQYGIRLDYSNNNSILGNTLLENVVRATLLFYSDNNTILHNTFNNSARTVWSVDSTNNMDNGVEGNYWSDYNGTDQDQDGIGDSPYRVDQNNQDNHPLMGAFADFAIPHAEKTQHVLTISNSTITHLQFDPTPGMLTFNVTGINDTAGFCRIGIPEELINSPYTVLVDERQANTTLVPTSDTTHTFVYFTYSHNTQEIKILSKPYYELLEEYNTLLASYDDLRSTFYQLNQSYQKILTDFNQSLVDLDALGKSYNELQGNYTSLLQLYNSLISTDRKTESERMALLYISVAAVAIAVIASSLTAKYYRKSEKEAKTIRKYKSELERISLLDSARTQFENDVQRRGEKIEGFERKYGITIRPRVTLEDTIKNLELKKKKED